MSQPTTWPIPQAVDAPVAPGDMFAAIKADLDALLSSHEGAAAPTYALEGVLWKKTGGGLYLYDGANFALVADLPGSRAAAAVTTAGADTILAADMLGGVILRSGPTAAYGDTFDTAANIVAAIPGAEAGMGFEFTIVNQVAYDNTLAAGTGITLDGVTLLTASKARRYLATITDAGSGTEAVTITGIMQGDA